MQPLRSHFLTTMLEAAQTLGNSANALLDLAARMPKSAARESVLAIARRLIDLTSSVKDGLSRPQRMAPVSEEALNLGERLARLAELPDAREFRGPLLKEVRRLMASAASFDTGMRQAAEARGLNLSA